MNFDRSLFYDLSYFLSPPSLFITIFYFWDLTFSPISHPRFFLAGHFYRSSSSKPRSNFLLLSFLRPFPLSPKVFIFFLDLTSQKLTITLPLLQKINPSLFINHTFHFSSLSRAHFMINPQPLKKLKPPVTFTTLTPPSTPLLNAINLYN